MAKDLKKIKDEILGVLSLFSSVYLFLSLFSHSKWDPSFFTYSRAAVRNYGGIFGAHLSDLIFVLIGFSAYSLPVFLAAYGIRRLLAREKHMVYLAGSVLFIFSSSLMLSLVLATFNISTENSPGGIIGTFRFTIPHALPVSAGGLYLLVVTLPFIAGPSHPCTAHLVQPEKR